MKDIISESTRIPVIYLFSHLDRIRRVRCDDFCPRSRHGRVQAAGRHGRGALRLESQGISKRERQHSIQPGIADSVFGGPTVKVLSFSGSSLP